MKVKRVCPICKTKKFRKTSDSGLVCKYGHQVLGVQDEQQDDNPQVLSSKRTKIKTVNESINNNTRSPVQQQSNFLRIVQYSLQVISRCMVQDLHFPPQLEYIVRELWILYLSSSRKEIEEAYMFEANGKEANEDSDIRKFKNSQTLDQEEKELDEIADDDEEEENSDQDNNQDDDDDDIKYKLKNRYMSKKSLRIVKWPKLKYSMIISILYLACLQLNYPILPNDLLRWIKTGQIPYLDIQKFIPKDILSTLSLTISNMMTKTPSYTTIIAQTYKIRRCYIKYCKLTFPPLNAPLYLSRFCSQFFLTVEGYYYAKRIFENCCKRHTINFSNPISANWTTPPMTILMACVIVTAKFIYGVGHGSSDYLHASKHDIGTTKEQWLSLVRENLTHLKNYKEKRQDLDYIIQLLRGRSVASRLTAALADRQTIALSILNRHLEQNNTQRYISNNKGEQNSIDDDGNLMLYPEIIKEGQVYYTHTFGFRPQDYADLIALANEILGDKANPEVEEIVETIERSFIHELKATSVPEKQYNYYFGLQNAA
ncbi:MAG: hypothetical protein EXX96DRAFT_517147 [Benjaminiella poitrasii]|nr:MAG: hypothetical protein EXX96DRAFT_517147 [Benjaminiella poitrasii]